MTDEEIHNIYLHMSGKAEGLVEANGAVDFPVLFARAILEYGGLTKDMQNMASKSTYKEQLETKDEPVAWMNDSTPSGIFARHIEGAKNFGCTIPLYTTPQPQEFVCSTGLCHLTLTQTNVGIGERGMEAYEAAKERGWVGLSDERLMKMPKQEPVLWMMPDGKTADKWALQFYGGQKGKPLYTAPPQSTWVGLTENQIDELEKEFIGFSVPNIYNFVQAIEAKLKERNT